MMTSGNYTLEGHYTIYDDRHGEVLATVRPDRDGLKLVEILGPNKESIILPKETVELLVLALRYCGEDFITPKATTESGFIGLPHEKH